MGVTNLNFLGVQEDIRIEELYIKTFNELHEKNLLYWKFAEELSTITNTTLTQVYNIIEKSHMFVMNSKGKITTRKIYEETTSFWRKLLDSYMNKIN
jgi:hypothetical protein